MRLAAILTALLLSSGAAAQGLEERPAGAASLGLAGAGVAALRTPAGLWLNPALLPQLSTHLAVELGLQSDTRSLTRANVVNELAVARDLEGVQVSPAVALAHPLGLRWLWAGAGYRLARQARSRYPLHELQASGGTRRAAPGRYLGTELSLEQHVVSVGLGAGCRWAGVGASLELSHLKLIHRRALWAGLGGDVTEDARLDMDARLQLQNVLTVGALLGAWARPLRWLELGFSLRIPRTADLRGALELRPGPRAPSGSTALDADGGEARLHLGLPLGLRGGLAVGPPRWRLLVDLSYQRWSASDDPTAELSEATLRLGAASGQTVERRLEQLPLGIGLRDSLALHAGAELAPLGDDRLVLRAGYAYHRGASVARQPSPVLLDLDRHVWAAGLQARAGWLTLGLAFSHSFEATLEVPESQAVLMNPLEPAITGSIGAGRYQSSRVRVIFEAGVDW